MFSQNVFTKVLLGSALLFSGSVAQANLISNGSFDTDLTGWTLSQDGGCGSAGSLPYSARVDNHVGRSGVVYINACGHGTGDPNISTTSSVSGLTIGSEYNLSWDFIRDTLGFQGAATDSFLVGISGITDSPFGYDYNVNSAWMSESLSFLASATSHSFSFSSEANGSDASYFLDNVVLVEAIPEPSILALFGAGLAGLGFARRRKQQS